MQGDPTEDTLIVCAPKGGLLNDRLRPYCVLAASGEMRSETSVPISCRRPTGRRCPGRLYLSTDSGRPRKGMFAVESSRLRESRIVGEWLARVR